MWIWASEKEIRLWLDGLRQLIDQISVGRDSTLDGMEDKGGKAASSVRQESGQEGERDDGDAMPRARASRASAPIQSSLESALGRKVELSTVGGSIQGVLAEVGDGFAVVRESEELIVIANLDQAIYVEVSGE
ncbi:hypothetical protein [Cohnella sp. AR92]|uniref:hypothetical protein n=1 Tax=Cohnella sp. AR92 TaxID=648716 RepID=UPI000F8D60AB|nr:hypothetical protein [Cohnella sp. AR92]RUS46787.1 hypothetical protein ELR57_13920 [Cohnella sp. AR92]